MSDPNKSRSKQNACAAVNFKKGDFCEAKDFANNWYKSRIIEIDDEAKKLKVHFLGWNSRYDQWFEISSSDIKPIISQEKKSKPTKVSEKKSAVVTENLKMADLFEVGGHVLAKWKLDNLYYPAVILRKITKGKLMFFF